MGMAEPSGWAVGVPVVGLVRSAGPLVLIKETCTTDWGVPELIKERCTTAGVAHDDQGTLPQFSN